MVVVGMGGGGSKWQLGSAEKVTLGSGEDLVKHIHRQYTTAQKGVFDVLLDKCEQLWPAHDSCPGDQLLGRALL
jgi:hypothetical protein